jgi:hypothetical protein
VRGPTYGDVAAFHEIDVCLARLDLNFTAASQHGFDLAVRSFHAHGALDRNCFTLNSPNGFGEQGIIGVACPKLIQRATEKARHT